MHNLLPLLGALSLGNAQASLSPADFDRLRSSLMEAVEAGYVEPARNDLIARKLEALESKPRTTDQAALDLTMALRDATGDMHFSVLHHADWFERAPDVSEAFSEMPREVRNAGLTETSEQQRENFYFRELSIRDGNVGYLRIDQMPDISQARVTLNAAMQFLMHVDAIILDLRFNPGGIAGFTPALASYFMPERGLELFRRESTRDSQSYRTDDQAGGRLSTVPLFVLISETTGSAAENLAYTLKNHGRATLVGENSGPGGAHSASLVRLSDGFVAGIPFARVIHPKTGSNWHRDGVEPDVATRPEQAAARAHVLALEQLLANADETRSSIIGRSLEQVRAELAADAPKACDEAGWLPFVGEFDIREIGIRDCQLALRRQGGPWLTLRQLDGAEPRFEMVLPTGAVSMRPLPEVRFSLADDRASELQFHHPDGTVERIARTD